MREVVQNCVLKDICTRRNMLVLNTVDPDQTAPQEQFDQDLQRLPF